MKEYLTALDRRAAGFLLVGPAGVGKTFLARSLLDATSDGRFQRAVAVATPAAVEVPLGVFARLLPADVARSSDLGALLGDLLERIVRDRHLVLLVDDAQWLDPASAMLVQHLALSGRATVLVTQRSGERLPEPIGALWKDGVLERWALEAFDRADTRRMVEEVLGGVVSDQLAGTTYDTTTGNPLYVTELLDAGLTTGAIERVDDVWHLVNRIPPSERLIDLIVFSVERVDAAQRDALDIVALGEPLPADQLAELVPAADLDDLARRRLIVVGEEGAEVDVRLAHPLFGEALRARMSPLKRRQWYGVMFESSYARRADARDALRMADWALSAGRPLPADVGWDAVRLAMTAHDPTVAQRMVDALDIQDAPFDHVVLAGEVALALGRFEEARRIFAGAARLAVDEHQLVHLTLTHAYALAHQWGRVDEAARITSEMLDEIGDPDVRKRAEVGLAELASWSGFVVDALRHTESLVADPMLSDDERLRVVSLHCFARSQTGPMDGLADLIVEGDALIEQLDAVHTVSWPWLRVGEYTLLRMNAGARQRHDQLLDMLAVSQQRDGPKACTGLWFSLLSDTLTMEGRMGEALTNADAGISSLVEQDPFELLHFAYVLSAMAALEAGLVERAEDHLALAHAERQGRPSHGRALLTHVEAGLLARRGRTDEAATMAAAIGQELLDQDGSRTWSATLLHQPTRVGHAAAVHDALRQAAEIDATYPRLAAAQAAAILAGDDDGLVETAAAWQRHGFVVYAAEACEQAADLLERRGDEAGAARRRLQRDRLMADTDGVRSPLLDGTTPVLSEREGEVVANALDGRSNRDVADRLFLSVRTVENHLARVYRRLGVSGRQELADLLDGAY